MVSIIALLIASQITATAAPQQVPQYLVQVSVREICPKPTNKPGIVLADPSLMVLAGREANFQVGEETKIGDEKIPWGTRIKLRVDPLPNNQVRVIGTIEVSNLSIPVEDIAARESKSIHLAKTMTCGKNLKVCMSKTANSETWCFLQIAQAEHQTAKLNSPPPR